MDKPSEKRSAAKSSMLWSFMIQGGNQIVTFIVTIVLARLLLPEQFGLIGMIAVFMAISRVLLDGGFVTSLVRTKNADNLDYSTVFFVNIISSLLIYAILFFTAPLIAVFYEQDILTDLIRVIGLTLIINALSLVQSTKLNIALQFKTQFKLQFPSLIISGLVAIWMANNGFGVWSLVAKDLLYALFATIQLWYYAKWIPSFVIDKEKLKYHFNFGYKLSLTSIINISFDNLYNIIIGKFFSVSQLGFFTRARTLEQLPSTFFRGAFNRFFFPLLAQASKDDEQLKKMYATMMKLIVFIVTPILVYLGVIAKPFFIVLLTEKWLPAVPFFQLLVISGIFYPIHQYNLNICNIKGRSEMVLKLSMLQNVLLSIGALAAIWFGIYGLLFSLIVVNILITFINAYFSGRLINYTIRNQISDLFPILALNFGMAILFYVLQITYFYKLLDVLNIIIVGLCFFITYIFLSYSLKLKVIKDLLYYVKRK